MNIYTIVKTCTFSGFQRKRGEEEEAQEGAEGEGLPPDQEGGESGRICGFRGVHRGVDYRETIDLQRVQDRVPRRGGVQDAHGGAQPWKIVPVRYLQETIFTVFFFYRKNFSSLPFSFFY